MPAPGELRAHLQKLLDSEALGGSEQLKRLLQTVVERTANGQADTLKEYTLGVEAFGRPPDFDPKVDPIVRVQARRLRTKLDEYYAGQGAADALRITMPKGGYVPVFETRAAAPLPPPPTRRPMALVLGTILILAGMTALALRDGTDPQSIAVLPLRNISDDPARQTIADQATEALVTSLARIQTLRVASGTTTRQVAQTQTTLPEIATALRVRWVVEGAAGDEDGRILLKMRLVDATSDRKIWADAITSTQDDLTNTQQKTAAAIAAAIEHVLERPQSSRP